MHNLMLIFAGFWLVQFFCVKAELNLIFQDIDAPILNEEYVRDFEGYISDDDEAAIICNYTVIKRFPEGLTGRFVLKGASMGEFVVPTGIDYKMDFCEMFDEPIIMGRLLTILGFRREDCPPSPGVYGTEGFVVDTETLPDEFPANNYLVVFEMCDADDEKVFVVHVFLRVY